MKGLSFSESLDDLLSAYSDLGILTIEHQFTFEEDLLSKGLCLSVYRILQEQINNTVKYARAATVCIDVRTKDNKLHLRYKDDGIGFDPATVKKGLGLNNIQHRVDAYNGKMEIRSAPSKGYEMEAWFPL